MRRPAGHLRCAISLKPPPTLTEPRPGDFWLSRDCRGEFRRARSGTPLPDSVLAVVGMTDGIWRGGSVTSTLRRGPCRASRHDRGRRAHEGASAGAAAGVGRKSQAGTGAGARRDEQKQTRGRAAWGDMVDGAGADMMAWGDALGVVARAMATSRRKDRR